jgi:hypothetical protein
MKKYGERTWLFELKRRAERSGDGSGGGLASILHEITRAQWVWTLGFTGETVGELHSNFHRITAFRDRLRDGLLAGVLQRGCFLPFVYSYGGSFRWRSQASVSVLGDGAWLENWMTGRCRMYKGYRCSFCNSDLVDWEKFYCRTPSLNAARYFPRSVPDFRTFVDRQKHCERMTFLEKITFMVITLKNRKVFTIKLTPF